MIHTMITFFSWVCVVVIVIRIWGPLCLHHVGKLAHQDSFIRQVGLQWLSFGWVSPPWLCAYFDFFSLINAWAIPWFYHWAGQSNLESFGWLGPIVILTLAWHPSKEFYWLMISKYEVWAGPHVEYEANLHFYMELDSSFTFLMSDTLIPPGINLVDVWTNFFRNPRNLNFQDTNSMDIKTKDP